MNKWIDIKGVFKIRVSGVITEKTYEKVNNDLKKFKFVDPVALALVVNSPGGSALHSDLIYKAIRSFADKHSIAVHSFAESVAASGGYYVLCAGDKVWATSQSTVFGSIGTVAFLPNLKGFVERFGVERRFWSTSGLDYFNIVDPLGTHNEEKSKKLKSLLQDIQDGFAGIVKERRKGKIVTEGKKSESVFNADVFFTKEALELGLADEKGTVDDCLKQLYPKQKVYDLSKRTWVEEITENFN